MPTATTIMDLDPTYKDAFGRPLIRLTYNGTDNDHEMSRYLLTKLEGIIKAMNPDPLRDACPAEELHHRALSIDPQYRRHDDGQPIRRRAW